MAARTTKPKTEPSNEPEQPELTKAGTEPEPLTDAERERIHELAEESLPETNKYGQTVSRTDQGRPFVVSNRFSVAHVENRGRELMALAPINHVGPAPILVPMAELDELISDLEALRDAPGPWDEKDED